ncbi:hypothetical protein OAK47_02275 [Planctomycetaceae bacterium]|mgnify:CR=1 FL=1|nr:hypothetical protein [Planctomycetaceae bacterium]MDG2391676.1 hypothetical protein [Planctomycetaceae bacterium]
MSRHTIAKIGFLAAAAASFAFSVGLWFNDYKEQGAFVGLWVPSILSLGTLIMAGQKHE